MDEFKKFESAETKAGEAEAYKGDILIGTQTEGRWPVEFTVPFEDATDIKLTTILRSIKKKISLINKIPVGLLTYENIRKKEVSYQGVRVVASISRCPPEKGDPALRFLNGRSSQGVEYENMALYLDLYPQKESGENVSLKDVDKLLQKAAVPQDKINLKALEDAFKIIQTDYTPAKNILLAQGRFPDPSFDAQMEFLFEIKELGRNRFMGAGKINREQVICKISPPAPGERPGYTVTGLEIPPPTPKDIMVVAGEGISISSDKTRIIATKDGILHVREEKCWEPDILSKLSFWIELLEVIDGAQQINIISEKNLEIVGGLKSGSKVVTQGEVIISGNIEKDASVVASGNINVVGNMENGKLVSSKDIDFEGRVNSSRLIAEGNLNLKGEVTKSELSGYEVHIGKTVGCKVTAGLLINIDTISTDESGSASVIIAGLEKQIENMIKENEEIIEHFKENLERFESIVGKEIVNLASAGNAVRMYIKFYHDMRRAGVKEITQEQSETVKRLISAIGPIRELYLEKTRQNQRLKLELDKRGRQEPKIVVAGGVTTPVAYEISGTKGVINPEDRGVMIQKSRGKLIKRVIKAQKRQLGGE